MGSPFYARIWSHGADGDLFLELFLLLPPLLASYPNPERCVPGLSPLVPSSGGNGLFFPFRAFPFFFFRFVTEV